MDSGPSGDAKMHTSVAAPKRVVSVNMCADELALRLARPGALASVTWLARTAFGSNVSGLARGVPVNHGAVEEVSSYNPDLVLAGKYTTRNTVALLKRLGARVVELDVPVTIDGVRQQIQDAALLLGNAAAGEALVKDFDARMPPVAIAAARPTAIVLRAAGFTTGAGTLIDDILRRAGMTNLAAERPLSGDPQPPLELVVNAQPDVLIINSDEAAPASLAHEVLEHPALQRLRSGTLVIALPTRLWTCAGPGVAEAVALLASAAAAWRATQPPAVRRPE